MVVHRVMATPCREEISSQGRISCVIITCTRTMNTMEPLYYGHPWDDLISEKVIFLYDIEKCILCFSPGYIEVGLCVVLTAVY